MSDAPSSPRPPPHVARSSYASSSPAAPATLNFTSPASVLRSDRHPNQSRFAFTASSPVADESFPAISSSSSSITVSGDSTVAPPSEAASPLPPRLHIPSTPSPRPSIRDSASPSNSLTTPLTNEDLPSFLPGRSPSQLATERARRAAEEAAREERLRGVQARKKQEAAERASPIKCENGYLQPFAKQPTTLHQRSPHSNSLDSPWRSLPPFNSSPRRSPSSSPSPAAYPAISATVVSATSSSSQSTSSPSVRLTADALKQLPATPASEKVRMARAAAGGVDSRPEANVLADDSESEFRHHIQITPENDNEEAEGSELHSSVSPSNCSCCSCEDHEDVEAEAEEPNSDDDYSICSCSVATDSESEFGSDCSDCDDEMVDENKRIIEAVHSVKSSFVYLPLILQSMVGMWLGQKIYTLGCNVLHIHDSIEQSRMQDLLLDGDAWKANNDTVTTTSTAPAGAKS